MPAVDYTRIFNNYQYDLSDLLTVDDLPLTLKLLQRMLVANEASKEAEHYNRPGYDGRFETAQENYIQKLKLVEETLKEFDQVVNKAVNNRFICGD